MKLAVVGAGGIGGFLAGALARSGADVAVVARGAHLAAIRRHGLRIESDLGAFAARVRADDDLRAFDGPFDALLLTFKAHHWPELFEQVAAAAGDGTLVVTLQNGLPFWFIREPPLARVDPGGRIGARFPDAVVAGGVVHVSGKLTAPGCVRQSGGTRYLLGTPTGGAMARLERLIAAMRLAGLEAESDEAIRTSVWLKLVNNCGLNPVSALLGLSIRALLDDAAARLRVRALMEEALRVGRAVGVRAEVDVDARLAYAARLDDVKTSMLQDRERGRALELDPILGAVIELGERLGVDVPMLREAYAELRCLTNVSKT